MKQNDLRASVHPVQLFIFQTLVALKAFPQFFSFLIADAFFKKKLFMSLFIWYLIPMEPSEVMMLVLVQSVEKFLDSQLFGLVMKYSHTWSHGNFVFRKAGIYYSVRKGHGGPPSLLSLWEIINVQWETLGCVHLIIYVFLSMSVGLLEWCLCHHGDDSYHELQWRRKFPPVTSSTKALSYWKK